MSTLYRPVEPERERETDHVDSHDEAHREFWRVPKRAARERVAKDLAEVPHADPGRMTDSVPVGKRVVAAEADRAEVECEEGDESGESEQPRHVLEGPGARTTSSSQGLASTRHPSPSGHRRSTPVP